MRGDIVCQHRARPIKSSNVKRGQGISIACAVRYLSVVDAGQSNAQLSKQRHRVLAAVVHHLDHGRVFEDDVQSSKLHTTVRVGESIKDHWREPIHFDLDERQPTVLTQVALDVDGHERVLFGTHTLLVERKPHTFNGGFCVPPTLDELVRRHRAEIGDADMGVHMARTLCDE